MFDLYLQDQAKILSLEWTGAVFTLIGMKRGDWEVELFDLPKYDPFA